MRLTDFNANQDLIKMQTPLQSMSMNPSSSCFVPNPNLPASEPQKASATAAE